MKKAGILTLIGILVLALCLTGCASKKRRAPAAPAALNAANSVEQEFGPSGARFTIRVPYGWRVAAKNQSGEGVRLEDPRRRSFCFVFVSREKISPKAACETTREMYEMEGANVGPMTRVGKSGYSFTLYGKSRAAGYTAGNSVITLFEHKGRTITEGHNEDASGMAGHVARSVRFRF